MGGNDERDKNGRPYELDDSQEDLYNRLQDLRDEVRSFQFFLTNLRDEYADANSSTTIELAVAQEILIAFEEMVKI